MDAAIKAKWLEALRSGEYRQGEGTFVDEGKHCCLGVLCEVVGKPPMLKGAKGYGFSNYEAIDGVLERSPASLLERMNDGVGRYRKRTFPEIADWIEEHL